MKIHPAALGGLVDPVFLSPVVNESDLNWIVLGNVRAAFPGGDPGVVINADSSKPWLASKEYEFPITFNPPVDADGWSGSQAAPIQLGTLIGLDVRRAARRTE